MKKSNWIFALLALAIIPVSFFVAGNGLYIYLDIPSAVIVFAGSYLLSLWAHGPAALGRAYRTAVKGGSVDEAKEAHSVFVSLQRHMIITGTFGLLTGFVAMLASVSEPEALSRGAAVALLTSLYTVVGIFALVAPFRASVAAQSRA